MFTITLNGICKRVSIFTTENVWIRRRWRRAELLPLCLYICTVIICNCIHRYFDFSQKKKQGNFKSQEKLKKILLFFSICCVCHDIELRLLWIWMGWFLSLNETPLLWRRAAFTCRVYAFTKRRKWFVHIDIRFLSYFCSDMEWSWIPSIVSLTADIVHDK